MIEKVMQVFLDIFNRKAILVSESVDCRADTSYRLDRALEIQKLCPCEGISEKEPYA